MSNAQLIALYIKVIHSELLHVQTRFTIDYKMLHELLQKGRVHDEPLKLFARELRKFFPEGAVEDGREHGCAKVVIRLNVDKGSKDTGPLWLKTEVRDVTQDGLADFSKRFGLSSVVSDNLA